MDTIVAGNPIERWLIALAVAVGTTLLLGVIKRVVVHRLGVLAAKTDTDLDDLVVDLIKRTRRICLLTIGLWFGSQSIDLAEKHELYLHKFVHLVLLLQCGFWGVGLVEYGLKKLVDVHDQNDPARAMGANVLGLIGRVLVWATVALLAISNLTTTNISALLTGLGVGGIAVALALQNVLGDLFASISILLDKPFVIGDSITVGEFSGTVEEIGIKTTRIKSVNGEQIIMGNADLVHSRIRNFKRLEERRSVFTLGVTYQTGHDKLERIPKLLREVIEATPQTRFDRAHFKSFGDSALQFEVAWFSLSREYNQMMDAQQAVNLAIVARFEREGIEFAYPTQTLHMFAANAERVAPLSAR